MTEKETPKEEKEKYTVADVATASEPRIHDGEKFYTLEEALVLVLNKLDKMQKKIVGE